MTEIMQIDYNTILADLIKKITIAVKKIKGIHVANIFVDNTFPTCTVTVETSEPLYVNDVIEATIRKHKYGVVLSARVDDGHFDWKADTYIKDSTSVTFTVK